MFASTPSVGVLGFEPRTSALSELRSSQLSYTPAVPNRPETVRKCAATVHNRPEPFRIVLQPLRKQTGRTFRLGPILHSRPRTIEPLLQHRNCPDCDEVRIGHGRGSRTSFRRIRLGHYRPVPGCVNATATDFALRSVAPARSSFPAFSGRCIVARRRGFSEA